MKLKLWHQLVIALILGIITGLILKQDAEPLKILGVIFFNLIKMVIVPLIFFALLSGITSLDSKSATRISVKGFVSYLLTASCAVLIGLSAATIFKPGYGVDLSKLVNSNNSVSNITSKAPSIMEFIINLISTNPIQSMASDNFLQIIVFSIFTGIVINQVGDAAKPLKEFIVSASKVTFKMIELIVKIAPIGVFGFVAVAVGTLGLDILESLIKLVILLFACCILQYIIFGVLIAVFGKISPRPFYKKMLFTQSMAFSTSSSKATLPTAMEQLETRMGVSKSSSNFMMPLGACINMDGTAIYLGLCAVFFAQSYGIDLTASNYMMLFLTCTLGSMGAAGVPSGSIIFMGMVLSSVGLPIEGIGILFAVDRILDMIRTTINITGDATITLLVDKSEGTLDEKTYYKDI